MIKNITVGSVINNDMLVSPYIFFKDGPKAVNSDPKIKLIAPALM